MAANNSGKKPTDNDLRDPRAALAALAAASRGAPTGRVRSLAEARQALRIPRCADPEVLRTWGVPADLQLTVYPVEEPDAPDLVAEFALLRVLKRRGSELAPRKKRERLRLTEISNALWVMYGSIVVAADASLVLESLALAPAFEGQLNRKGDAIAHGISAQLLRLISPSRIIAACAEQLHANGYWLEQAARYGTGGGQLSEKHRNLLDRVDHGRPRHAAITDDLLIELSQRYLTLYRRGNRRPRAQLAGEFGLTDTQVRDRLHKARQRGYLTPGSRGRAGGEPGPHLQQLG